jgi:hypothetical protein
MNLATSNARQARGMTAENRSGAANTHGVVYPAELRETMVRQSDHWLGWIASKAR